MSEVRKPLAKPTDQQAPKARAGLTMGGIPVFTNEPMSEGMRDDRISMSENNYFVRDEELGRGGMGVVYKARHIVTRKDGKKVMEKVVAIKEIKLDDSDFGSEPDVAEAQKKKLYEHFFSEVETVSKLRHENIVEISNFGETDDARPFYVMEYLEGMDLLSLIQQKKSLEWDTMRPLILQVVSAMVAAHGYEEEGESRPIIHRDIKPENVFLTKDSDGEMKKVKVLDFGLAKIMIPKKAGESAKNEGVHGTAEYMSPEQANGWEVDHRTDIYATGALMYAMLSGDPPFLFDLDKQPNEFENPHNYRDYFNQRFDEFRARLNNERPPELLAVAPEVKRIVMKCLEKKPEDRYQTMKELKKDMQKLPKKASLMSMSFIAESKHPSLVLGDTLASPTGIYQKQVEPEAPQPKTTETPVMVRPSQRPKKPKMLKWLALGGGGAAALIAGTAILAYSGFTKKNVEPKVERPIAAHHIGAATPQTLSSISPESEPAPKQEAKSVTVQINRKPASAKVFMDGTEVCDTGDCQIILTRGELPVELTFKRFGYMELTKSIVPKQDMTLEISLEKTEKKKAQPTPPVKGRPKPLIITSPD